MAGFLGEDEGKACERLGRLIKEGLLEEDSEERDVYRIREGIEIPKDERYESLVRSILSETEHKNV